MKIMINDNDKSESHNWLFDFVYIKTHHSSYCLVGMNSDNESLKLWLYSQVSVLIIVCKSLNIYTTFEWITSVGLILMPLTSCHMFPLPPCNNTRCYRVVCYRVVNFTSEWPQLVLIIPSIANKCTIQLTILYIFLKSWKNY